MFDTPVTVIGNVLTAPEWRRTTVTGTFVVTFKVASHSRRFDRERGQWVDGPSLRVRVTCWRRLGENVSVSVQLGDPVVVHGRLYSRDWTDEQGTRRTSYELDATSVGHDLSKGVDKFARRKPAGPTTFRPTTSCSTSSTRRCLTPRRSRRPRTSNPLPRPGSSQGREQRTGDGWP